MLITMSGIIGAGKSTLTEILANELGTQAFYESVSDNPVLPLFYKGNEKIAKERAQGIEDTTNPYAYLLQTYFLNSRFHMIKKAMQDDNNILDRSIYEDAIFMRMNYELGNTSQVEWDIYNDLLQNMLEELPYAAHKKSPDLMVMVDVNYETMLSRIEKRGREYEQIANDPSLVNYYHTLLRYYEDWKYEYDASELLVIDGNQLDFVGNQADRRIVLETIEDKLFDLGKITRSELQNYKEQHEMEAAQ